MKINEDWIEKYNLAKEYYEKHGNLSIPKNYTVFYNDKKIRLGFWINEQRQTQNEKSDDKLTQTKIDMLNQIGMFWYSSKKDKISWEEKYKLAKEYYEEHGNLLIPTIYPVIYKGQKVELGTWIQMQRQAKRGYGTVRITQEKIALLNEIGMVWDNVVQQKKITNIISENWLEKYELAKEYYEAHGNLLIPVKYTVICNDKEIRLGGWIQAQRQAKKGNGSATITEEQVDLLNKIGMVWDNIIQINKEKKGSTISKNWLKKYELAKEYYEKHGNLLIPEKYTVTCDNKEIKLGMWIQVQRQAKKGNGSATITEEQVDLLNEIGMVWDNVRQIISENITVINLDIWLKKYKLAKEYYEEHGNLLIPERYVVIENNRIIRLGRWIKEQRKANSNNNLTQNQINLLNEIKMIWDAIPSNLQRIEIEREKLEQLRELLDEQNQEIYVPKLEKNKI